MDGKEKISFKSHAANGVFAIAWYWRNSRRMFYAQLLDAISDSVIPIAQALLAGAIVTELANVAQGQPNATRLLLFVALSAAVNIFVYGLNSLMSFARTRYQDVVRIELMDSLYRERLKLPLEQYELPKTNDKFKRANEGAYEISWYTQSLFGMLAAVVSMVGSAFIILSTVPLLLFFLLPLPIITTSTRMKYYLLSRKTWEEARPHRQRAWNIENLLEREQGAVEIRLFNVTKKLMDVWRKESMKGVDVQVSHQRNSLKLDLWLQVAESGVAVLADIWLVIKVIAGSITVGVFEQTRRLVGTYIGQMVRFTQSLSQIAEYGYKIADYRTFVAEATHTVEDELPKLKQFPSQLVFNSVSFTYPNSEQPALQDVNVSIRAGEHIALVGENGAGKTTLIKVLLGLYQSYEGQILLEEKDARSIDHSSIWQFTAPLMQEFQDYQFLTIKESVAVSQMGSKVHDDEVRKVLKLVGLDSFVDGLPKGLDTNLGFVEDDGVKLSGGQWQRLAIARALFRKADLLVLDEPTSAIDAKSEQDIIDNIFDSYTGKTVLIVSHRLSTVRRADRIIVMKDGRIVEEGTHKQLFKSGRAYYDLFHKQAMRLSTR